MMSAPGAPNGGGPNQPTDPEPDVSETNSETTSSNITIQDHELAEYYVQRHGRMFHTFPRSPYFLPADDEEAIRLREQHAVLQALVGEAYYQPLRTMLGLAEQQEAEKVVLDLGCGPGIWVEEFARGYQFAYFIGVDLVPMARQGLNEAHFECYDISARGIRRDDGDVDTVHMRYGNFYDLIRDTHRVLSNGGILLSIEIDWRPDYQIDFPRFNLQATLDFLHRVAECAALANAGTAWDPTRIPTWLVDAGFTDIQRDMRLLPVGQWSGSQPMREVGRLAQLMCIKFAEAMRPAFTLLLRDDPQQVEHLIAEVRNELASDENTGWSIPVHLVTASKDSHA
ncbi:hypothetical protein FRB90_012470 [Tulasnella sp. 427]|nr:hypothetical protein FRB90_012470 [Tulasnella sp. 427]